MPSSKSYQANVYCCGHRKNQNKQFASAPAAAAPGATAAAATAGQTNEFLQLKGHLICLPIF